MRLLYVIDSLTPGGAETSLAEMAPGLISLGVELHVLPLGRRVDLADRLMQAGAILHMRDHNTNRIGNVRAVLAVAQRVRPDLLHTTLYEADIAGRLAAKAGRFPVTTSIVGDTYAHLGGSLSHALKVRLARGLDRSTAGYARRFHVVSATLATSTTKHLGVPTEKIDVIPRGRSANRFPFQPPGVRKSVRSELGLRDDNKVLLAVGRLEPAKGLIDLIRALPLVSAEFPGVVLLIAGKKGQESAALRQASSESGADVRFLGHREDIPRLLAAADLLCFPSHSEGSPGTLIEAMAVGCPIVASNIPANLEILGFSTPYSATAPVGEPSFLASTIIRTLNDPAATKNWITKARRRFDAAYRIESVTTRMNEFFERAAS